MTALQPIGTAIMATPLISLLLFLLLLFLGVVASCTYACLMSWARSVSDGAGDIDCFQAETEEGCMILRIEDHLAQRSERHARSKAA